MLTYDTSRSTQPDLSAETAVSLGRTLPGGSAPIPPKNAPPSRAPSTTA